MSELFDEIGKLVDSTEGYEVLGKVVAVKGLIVEVMGLDNLVAVGSRCKIHTRNHHIIDAEVVGFKSNIALMMPFQDLEGVGIGCKVAFVCEQPVFYPDISWLGRVINGAGEPIDGKGPLFHGSKPVYLKNTPPNSHKRSRLKEKIDLGVKSVNSFLSCCYGQRMGVFAGSGVGKSVLISMVTKFAKSDVKIIGLVGERGREVQEFLNEYLGEEGIKQAIVIVATGDEAALMRRQAAYLTLSLAEYFRDAEKNVLCIIDNVTRFAMAQREIGLASGEPPSSKGYTPTVFSELPKLLERAGPGEDKYSITGLFAVLVEGDDTNEPIADATRGILDGHIVLDRTIAERGRFPAVNILKSISRTMPNCNNDKENALVMKARRLLATYEDMAEMIRIGAYRKGSDKEIDEAIIYYPKIEAFLAQKPHESISMEDSYKLLAIAIDDKEYNTQEVVNESPNVPDQNVETRAGS